MPARHGSNTVHMGCMHSWGRDRLARDCDSPGAQPHAATHKIFSKASKFREAGGSLLYCGGRCAGVTHTHTSNQLRGRHRAHSRMCTSPDRRSPGDPLAPAHKCGGPSCKSLSAHSCCMAPPPTTQIPDPSPRAHGHSVPGTFRCHTQGVSPHHASAHTSPMRSKPTPDLGTAGPASPAAGGGRPGRIRYMNLRDKDRQSQTCKCCVRRLALARAAVAERAPAPQHVTVVVVVWLSTHASFASFAPPQNTTRGHMVRQTSIK